MTSPKIMRTKVQRRIPNWSRKREQLYTGHGGTGGAVHWGGTQQTSRAASQIPLRVQIRTSALDRRYLEIHVYASSYEVWPSKFSDPITHFNHQDCFPPTHRIEFPIFFPYFLKSAVMATSTYISTPSKLVTTGWSGWYVVFSLP